LKFLLSVEEEELGDNVADMISCSTDENLLRTQSSNAAPACSKTLKCFNEAPQRFRIYPLSYEALQRFIEALSNLTRPRQGNGACLFLQPRSPHGTFHILHATDVDVDLCSTPEDEQMICVLAWGACLPVLGVGFSNSKSTHYRH